LTITLKAVSHLQVGTLAAAASPGPRARPLAVAHQRFALAALPPAATAPAPRPPRAAAGAAGGAAGAREEGGCSGRLVIWDGRDAVICNCHDGVDPSHHAVDMTLTPRARKLYMDAWGDAAAAEAAGGGRPLEPSASDASQLGADGAVIVRLPFAAREGAAARPAGGGAAAGSEAALGCAVDRAVGGVRQAASAASGDRLQGLDIPVVFNPATSGEPVPAPSGRGSAGAGAVGAAGPALAGVWRRLSGGDAAFLRGEWEACEAAYRALLPFSYGHLVSVGRGATSGGVCQLCCVRANAEGSGAAWQSTLARDGPCCIAASDPAHATNRGQGF
jgi:hypothetical protein